MQSDMTGTALPVVTSPTLANGNVTLDGRFGCTSMSYGKGASVNYYIASYLGASTWNKGNNHIQHPNKHANMQTLTLIFLQPKLH